jgi:hypothetical protein
MEMPIIETIGIIIFAILAMLLLGTFIGFSIACLIKYIKE